ncbi:hypothetical protein OG800_50305 (plasmid) [Streptomyces sp. NBC_00445]|uniref:hypothetical protein n=1 Tax=Streptomyces sp. NBC_00445 TaxID=2975745 RepID=UPI002E216BCF
MSSKQGAGGGRRIKGEVGQHGVHVNAPISRLNAQSAHLLGEAVIVMIQPDTVAVTGEDGQLMTGDTVEATVKAHGGKPLTLPPDFRGEPTPGWVAHLDTSNDELLIHFPGGHVFYDGTMPTTEQWRKDIAAVGSVVVITGPMAAVSDIEPVLVAGRAHWTRIPITIGSGPAEDEAPRTAQRTVADTAPEEPPSDDVSDPEAMTEGR